MFQKTSYQIKAMITLQPLLDNDLIEKVVLDTYSREIERYGDSLIEETENLFFADSLAVLRFVSLLDEEDGGKYRMLFALRGIDMLLEDFNFSLAEKRELLKNTQSGFFKEFGGSSGLEKQLNDKYRKVQKEIFLHMNPDMDAENEIVEAVSIFKQRSTQLKPTADNILFKLENDKEEITKLLISYIHMFMNRLFIYNQRKYELVIYHFLERYYSSQLAIDKKKEMLVTQSSNLINK